jgi:hypothetical protein
MCLLCTTPNCLYGKVGLEDYRIFTEKLTILRLFVKWHGDAPNDQFCPSGPGFLVSSSSLKRKRRSIFSSRTLQAYYFALERIAEHLRSAARR